MSSLALAWTVLAVVGAGALAADLYVGVRRDDHRLRTGVLATVGWTVAGLGFAAVVRGLLGPSHAGEYLTVFLLEKSLSLDNVAVFAVVLTALAVPTGRRQRVLAGGIVGALVLRLLLVAVGLALVSAVHGVLVVFGVILLVAGARMALPGREHDGPPRAVQWLRRRRVSPVAAALVALAVTDLVFAIDSVPAAFAVTDDAFVIMAANVFAVLGLRPMYDVLVVAMARLVHLERALGVLLALIGAALVVEPVWAVPQWLILVAVVSTLGAGLVVSVVPPCPLPKRRRASRTVGEDGPDADRDVDDDATAVAPADR